MSLTLETFAQPRNKNLETSRQKISEPIKTRSMSLNLEKEIKSSELQISARQTFLKIELETKSRLKSQVFVRSSSHNYFLLSSLIL